jgi:hypothetical protein
MIDELGHPEAHDGVVIHQQYSYPIILWLILFGHGDLLSIRPRQSLPAGKCRSFGGGNPRPGRTVKRILHQSPGQGNAQNAGLTGAPEFFSVTPMLKKVRQAILVVVVVGDAVGLCRT